MELLKKDIKPLFFKYLGAAFGSALISSIYVLVDMAMVGQYEGPNGTAAMAVVAPIWNIMFSLGLLTGIGGSVLFSSIKGRAEKNDKQPNEYFTTAVIYNAVFAFAFCAIVLLFSRPLLTMFGGEGEIMELALIYLKPIQYVIPVFMFTPLVSAFLRNDNNPGLATCAVLVSGVFNIVADYVFVFPMDMGIYGAGLATAISPCISLLIMLTHFISKKNTIRFAKPSGFLTKIKNITVQGFSVFIVDIAMGVLTVIFNNQIVKYAGPDALAIYGIIVNIGTIVQNCAYSVGQAAQPIISINYGAMRFDRIKQTLKYAMGTAVFFGIVWTTATVGFPNFFMNVFMKTTPSVLEIAPKIMRCYCISFLILPINIFSTYYFQSILMPGVAFSISVTRGIVLSGALIYILPAIFGADAMWLAIPITEALVCVWAVFRMYSDTRKLIDGAKIDQAI